MQPEDIANAKERVRSYQAAYMSGQKNRLGLEVKNNLPLDGVREMNTCQSPLFKVLPITLVLFAVAVFASDELEATREAAENGDSYAQFNLGFVYYTGDGAPKDYTEAIHWFLKGAEQEHAMSQLMVGSMYADGKGVPRDDNKAVEWYRRSAERGDQDAQRRLGDMYYGGRGVGKNKADAARWYRKAAEQGDAVAQHMLGAMYYWGSGGLRKDLVKAYAWYYIAYENGYDLTDALGPPQPPPHAHLAENEMSLSQIIEGEKLAREYAGAYGP